MFPDITNPWLPESERTDGIEACFAFEIEEQKAIDDGSNPHILRIKLKEESVIDLIDVLYRSLERKPKGSHQKLAVFLKGRVTQMDS